MLDASRSAARFAPIEGISKRSIKPSNPFFRQRSPVGIAVEDGSKYLIKPRPTRSH